MKSNFRTMNVLWILALICSLHSLEGQEKSIKVQDVLNRTFTFSRPVSRIVSLSPAITETLYAIGAGNTLVGNTTYCTYPAAAQTVPKVGGYTADTISIEQIINQKPDLVIGEISIHRSLESSLQGARISLFLVDLTRIEDIYTLMQKTALLTGREKEGAELQKQLQQKLSSIVTLINSRGTSKRPRVFWEVWHEPLITCGPHTFIGQILTLAGAENIFSDLSENWPIVSFEMVLLRNPEYILTTRSHGELITLEAISKRPGWASLSAVRNKQVVFLDDDIMSRPGPRFVEAVELVARSLYPQLFRNP
ncbi:MAG: cobalamin-binding protein [Treponemataceae bacterium]|nr:cobalamin-binding protein [Treponemataceae bacterium]